MYHRHQRFLAREALEVLILFHLPRPSQRLEQVFSYAFECEPVDMEVSWYAS